jgi:hypothetical protein
MKYLIQDNRADQELVADIADFLWDNGNEVVLCSRLLHNIDDGSSYCTVTFKDDDAAKKYLKMSQNQSPEENRDSCSKLVFATTGVYTNIIPHPYKIFNYNELNKKALHSFIRWCTKFKLFYS